MYKIVMIYNRFDGRKVQTDMRGSDTNLGLYEACFRADLYKKRNEKACFLVVNKENGDIEYEI